MNYNKIKVDALNKLFYRVFSNDSNKKKFHTLSISLYNTEDYELTIFDKMNLGGTISKDFEEFTISTYGRDEQLRWDLEDIISCIDRIYDLLSIEDFIIVQENIEIDFSLKISLDKYKSYFDKILISMHKKDLIKTFNYFKRFELLINMVQSFNQYVLNELQEKYINNLDDISKKDVLQTLSIIRELAKIIRTHLIQFVRIRSGINSIFEDN